MDGAKETTRLTKLTGDTREIKYQMEKNITSITDRGECLDTLGGKASSMSSEAGTFKKGARRLKTQKKWSNRKLRICLAICIPLSIIAVLLVAACGAALVILKPWDN
ncbi:uncharacterized protein LOC135333584 isoform X2 [Halichondria panicea]|uniref:uncharacterized protein LOC135333584 isoform X2 n=1 Tax=Halichondria panicea TaxID=6063 RepID=UPI00312B9E4E